MNLPKHKLRTISLGYIWNPNMSYEEFCTKNKLPIRGEDSTGYEMYNKIENRYMNFLKDNL